MTPPTIATLTDLLNHADEVVAIAMPFQTDSPEKRAERLYEALMHEATLSRRLALACINLREENVEQGEKLEAMRVAIQTLTGRVNDLTREEERWVA